MARRSRLVVVCVDSIACSLRCLLRWSMYRECLVIDVGSGFGSLVVFAVLRSSEALPVSIEVDTVYYVPVARSVARHRIAKRVSEVVELWCSSCDVCVDCSSSLGLYVASEASKLVEGVERAIPRSSGFSVVEARLRELMREFRCVIEGSFAKLPLGIGRYGIARVVKRECRGCRNLANAIKSVATEIPSVVDLEQVSSS